MVHKYPHPYIQSVSVKNRNLNRKILEKQYLIIVKTARDRSRSGEQQVPVDKSGQDKGGVGWHRNTSEHDSGKKVR